ncbi:MAG: formate dehydrogenase [Alphaproteobacteria bacterium]|nr:MAG: formate dehydrogenase [Alphaproteobacteria bacterium]
MSEPKATIGRRQLLRAGMTGLFVATASALEPGTAAADTETNSEKRKPRFQPNAAEVKNFYRVNRYPAPRGR